MFRRKTVAMRHVRAARVAGTIPEKVLSLRYATLPRAAPYPQSSESSPVRQWGGHQLRKGSRTRRGATSSRFVVTARQAACGAVGGLRFRWLLAAHAGRKRHRVPCAGFPHSGAAAQGTRGRVGRVHASPCPAGLVACPPIRGRACGAVLVRRNHTSAAPYLRGAGSGSP